MCIVTPENGSGARSSDLAAPAVTKSLEGVASWSLTK